MDLTFTEEHNALRDLLRRFLAERAPLDQTRTWLDREPGFDLAAWHGLAREIGVQGMNIPEGYGGQGLGAVELAIVMEELGRVLYSGPVLGTSVLAANALLDRVSGSAATDALSKIAAGDLVAALAVPDDGGSWRPDAVRTTCEHGPDGWTVTGAKDHVLDGHVAQLLLIVARLPTSQGSQGLALLAVDADASGLHRQRLPSIDPTRSLVRLELERTPALLLAQDITGAVDRIRDRALTFLAAEIIGGARRCLEIAVEHARTRVQFGQPIGSFQALKHKCADMLVDIEHATSAAYVAACHIDEREPQDVAVPAAIAATYCSETYVRVARETLQILGGIGFTWEHDAHLYVRRAQASRQLLGAPSWHLDRLFDLVSS